MHQPSSPVRVFLFILFPADRPHRDLHSFPTRRSSDLPTVITRSPSGVSNQGTASARVQVLIVWAPADQHLRSEEHTSELQSRENLVCRLLLEKKKTILQNSKIYNQTQNIGHYTTASIY